MICHRTSTVSLPLLLETIHPRGNNTPPPPVARSQRSTLEIWVSFGCSYPQLSPSLLIPLQSLSWEKEVPKRAMLRNLRTILRYQRPLHTLSSDKLPSEMLRKKIDVLENIRRKKKSSKRDEFIVNVPGNTEFLDTPTMPMILIAVGIAIFAKLLMIHDDATAQERLERKMKKLPPGTGTVRMLSKEEWEAIQDIGPRTPYESKYARPNARLRTGDPMHMEDVKDWTIDVLRDGLSRIEECVKHKN